MSRNRPDYRETLIRKGRAARQDVEAEQQRRLDAYGLIRSRLEIWGEYMRAFPGLSRYRSPDWRNPVVHGPGPPEPEIPEDIEIISRAVQRLPSQRQGLQGPQEYEAIEARYLWKVFKPDGSGGRPKRLHEVRDSDVGPALGVGRSKGYHLLQRALAHLSGQLEE